MMDERFLKCEYDGEVGVDVYAGLDTLCLATCSW